MVRLEAGALREALGARRAAVGLLAAVHNGVAHQVAVLGEAAAAGGAAERFLARVAAQVLLQLAQARKALRAERAAVHTPLRTR